MAYPSHHPGAGGLYPYKANATTYQRQNSLQHPHQLYVPQGNQQPALPPPPPPPPQHYSPSQHSLIGISTLMEPPQTPEHESDAVERREEDSIRNRPKIAPISKEIDGRAYLLEVCQQPERARMCGFGDKDRRPISAPPCVKLIINDTTCQPHKEISYKKVEDLSRYVVMVDLVDVDSLEEKNCVSHPAQSPSISTVTATAFPPTQTTASPSGGAGNPYSVGNFPSYQSQQHQYGTANGYGSRHSQAWSNGNVGGGWSQSQQSQYGYNGSISYPGGYTQPTVAFPPDAQRASISNRGSTGGTMSRNLIGQTSASAFKLSDLSGEQGLWFIFQDLSVRTEGWFRLKFTLFNLKANAAPEASTSKELSQFAPLLAECHSNPFKVYSAKRFPGVIESTALSKKFAEQGIKIPIRKDGGKEGQRSGDKRKRYNSDDEARSDDDDD